MVALWVCGWVQLEPDSVQPAEQVYTGVAALVRVWLQLEPLSVQPEAQV
jgi:hypothetical protein